MWDVIWHVRHVIVWAGKVIFGLSFHVLSEQALDVCIVSLLTVFQIWGNCPCYFAHVNEQDFESTWLWNVKTRWDSCVLIAFQCWFIVPVATDSSVFIRSNIVWNQWKRSIRVCLNQRRTNYVNTVYFVHQGKSGEILESVARRLFTLTINEYTIAIYIMIKYTFQINF